jgi:hypothetical protein
MSILIGHGGPPFKGPPKRTQADLQRDANIARMQRLRDDDEDDDADDAEPAQMTSPRPAPTKNPRHYALEIEAVTKDTVYKKFKEELSRPRSEAPSAATKDFRFLLERDQALKTRYRDYLLNKDRPGKKISLGESEEADPSHLGKLQDVQVQIGDKKQIKRNFPKNMNDVEFVLQPTPDRCATFHTSILVCDRLSLRTFLPMRTDEVVCGSRSERSIRNRIQTQSRSQALYATTKSMIQSQSADLTSLQGPLLNLFNKPKYARRYILWLNIVSTTLGLQRPPGIGFSVSDATTKNNFIIKVVRNDPLSPDDLEKLTTLARKYSSQFGKKGIENTPTSRLKSVWWLLRGTEETADSLVNAIPN